MKKIYYDSENFFWKTKLNLLKSKSFFLNECNSIINSLIKVKTDGFIYKWNEKLK